MYLAIRSDKPETEIYLLDNQGKIVKQKLWDANRTLARDLPGEIDALVNGDYGQLNGVIAFRGPGSFTGLRIGVTVANSIAYANGIAIVGCVGDDWLSRGVEQLNGGTNNQIVLPEYGAAPHITPARK